MSIEAMKQALEHLERVLPHGPAVQMAKDVLRQAIALQTLTDTHQAIEQAEQAQPVAWRFDHKDGQGYCYYDERWPAEFIPQDATPLYL